MIYIDPPYNTGNDFVYEDDFKQNAEDYLASSGQLDEEGNRLFQNTESNGRFHTDWLNMIYPRLKIAKDLLTDDGVIFISIDLNESYNLRKICNEVFGESNFITDIVWKHTQQSKNDEKYFSRQYNNNLVFCKNINYLKEFYFERTNEDNKNYSNPDNDSKGLWRSGDVRSPNYRKTLCYDIIAPNGKIIKSPENGWRWSEESFISKIASGEIIYKPDYSGIIRKIYLNDQKGRTPENLWEGDRFGTTRQATATIKSLFDNIQVFDTPKPYELVKAMLTIGTYDNSIILDFFSGSATTAHAVMQLNAEDGGNRKFIMVQLPELCDEKSEAYKAGYKNICEIGKERIRRAGKKIKDFLKESGYNYQKLMKEGESYQFFIEEEDGSKTEVTGKTTGMYDTPKNPEEVNKKIAKDVDIGFRVLKVDSSNMTDVYYQSNDYSQDLLDKLTDNIKPDRTVEDLLFQVMLDLGKPLSAKITLQAIAGKKIFVVGELVDGVRPDLICCFDSSITEAVVTAIAKLQPLYAVFRDSSLSNDSLAANFEQIFETYSANTIRKVI